MIKHTKGEWYFCENGHVRAVDTDYVICTPGDGGHIDDSIVLISPAEQEANGHRIASIPKMLAALRATADYLKVCDPDCIPLDLKNEVEKAIGETEGHNGDRG